MSQIDISKEKLFQKLTQESRDAHRIGSARPSGLVLIVDLVMRASKQEQGDDIELFRGVQMR